ncbi:hypothetical protein [Streptomyces sp. NPDC048436]|uniref:hypothetical protein n=1 Tax=Streptomyces sp. NPDC048436 TaxID=3365550 RepID=UPI00371C3F63
MPRLARALYVPSVALSALGTVTATLGVLHDQPDVFRLGMIALVAAIPALCYCLTHRATRVSDYQLTETHSAGYRLALQHVSLGLLGSPAAPPDGGEGVEEEEAQGIVTIPRGDLPDNVRPIRSHDDEEDTRKRKAQ